MTEEFVLVPVEPTEAMWSGLARQLVFAFQMQAPHTPRRVLAFLENTGTEIPTWLKDEPEMQALDHSISKGTRAVMIYRAMLNARPTKYVQYREVMVELIDAFSAYAKDYMVDEAQDVESCCNGDHQHSAAKRVFEALARYRAVGVIDPIPAEKEMANG